MTHYICTRIGTGSVYVVNGVRAPTKKIAKGISIAAIVYRRPEDPGGSGADDEGGIEGTGIVGIGIEGTGVYCVSAYLLPRDDVRSRPCASTV